MFVLYPLKKKKTEPRTTSETLVGITMCILPENHLLSAYNPS